MLPTPKVMLPYIDNAGAHVEDQGLYWMVCEDGGDYQADCTDGTATSLDDRPRCSTCDEPTEDCECSYCECCERSYRDGCENCSMCEECDGCREHDGCSCARCSECSELIEPRNRWSTRCEGDRCPECEGLESECECQHCERCNYLTSDCECPDENEETAEAPAEPNETIECIREPRELLEAVWTYLRNEKSDATHDSERNAALGKALQILREMANLVILDETRTELEMTA